MSSDETREAKRDREFGGAVLLAAREEFHTLGTCSVKCDRCGGIVTITALGDAVWQADCPCGRYRLSMKGL